MFDRELRGVASGAVGGRPALPSAMRDVRARAPYDSGGAFGGRVFGVAAAAAPEPRRRGQRAAPRRRAR